MIFHKVRLIFDWIIGFKKICLIFLTLKVVILMGHTNFFDIRFSILLILFKFNFSLFWDMENLKNSLQNLNVKYGEFSNYILKLHFRNFDDRMMHELKINFLRHSTGAVALSIQGTEQRLRWPTSSFEAALKEHGYSM